MEPMASKSGQKGVFSYITCLFINIEIFLIHDLISDITNSFIKNH